MPQKNKTAYILFIKLRESENVHSAFLEEKPAESPLPNLLTQTLQGDFSFHYLLWLP